MNTDSEGRVKRVPDFIVKTSVIKIISGGQTGVDRAALEFAIQHGFPHGGWCPRGRLAEDGVIPPIYRLGETESSEYEERTERNVLDSDATLIVARQRELSAGTAFTRVLAEKHGRPLLVVHEGDGAPQSNAALVEFIRLNKVRTLNVAGPRESQAPGLGRYVEQLLAAALAAPYQFA